MKSKLSWSSGFSVCQVVTITSLLFLSLTMLSLASPATAGPCIGGTVASNQTYSGSICFDLLIVKSGVTVTIQNATIDNLVVAAGGVILGNISLESNAYLNINTSIIGTLSLYDTYPASAQVTVLNNGIDWINVYAGEPSIQNNEIYAQVGLRGRSGAIINNNIFYGKNSRVAFLAGTAGISTAWDQGGASPFVTGNSFLGTAPFDYTISNFPPTAITIGSNYYGEAACTVDQVLKSKGDWFDNRCSSIGFTNEKVEGGVTKKILSMEIPLSSGEFPKKDLHPAEIWVEASTPLVGQYTLNNNGYPSIRMQGLPSLMTFSLITNRKSTSISDLYATVDGVKVRPKKMISTVYRDSADCKAPCAIDIILPPVNKDSALVELFFTNASGTTKLGSADIPFDKPYARTYNIVIQPIQVMTPFYNHAVPDAAAVKEFLYSTLPAMLPLQPEDLFVISMPVEKTYVGSYNFISAFDTAVRGVWNTVGYFSTGVTGGHPMDLILEVVACGNVGQEGGSNYRFRRNIIFVEDCKINALVHEMGHTFGLYTGTEQYDQYPATNGRPVEGATLFMNSQSAQINGFGKDGVLHLPGPDSSWKSSSSYWMDIMSAAPNYIWPIQETLDGFYAGLRRSLGTSASSGSTAARASGNMQALSSPPDSSHRRLFLYGETRPYRDIYCSDPVYSNSNPLMRYQIQSGTMWAMDLTPLAVNSTPPATLIPPDPFFYCFANFQEPLSAYFFDASGSLMSEDNLDFAVEPNAKDVILTHDYWFATLDVPEAAHRMKIVSPYGDSYLDLTVADMSTQITQPSAGELLTSTLTVKWNSSSSGGQPLRHMLFYRTNSSQNWKPLSQIQTETSFTFSTDILPASNTLSLLLLSSNGLRSQTSQVDGLHIANHAPQVTIYSPRNGDVAEPGTPWSLRAFALDTEDGPINTGSWTSSLDGVLSVGSLPSSTLLSPGVHQLTFSAHDSQGLLASSSVTVTVAANPAVDLGWLPADLSIVRAGEDPTTSLLELTPQITHTAYLSFQNTGVPITATVSLYLQDPKGVETLILQKAISLAAFEPWSGSVNFIPKLIGDYRFRAKLDLISPVDANLANNQRTWDYIAPDQVFQVFQVFLPVINK
jgi:hypothetical protein